MNKEKEVIKVFNVVAKNLSGFKKKETDKRVICHKSVKSMLKHNFMTLTKITGLSPLVWCDREGGFLRIQLVISPDNRSLEERWYGSDYYYYFHDVKKTKKILKEAIKRHKLNIGEIQAKETEYKKELSGLERVFQEIQKGG